MKWRWSALSLIFMLNVCLGCAPFRHKQEIAWHTGGTEKVWKLRVGQEEKLRLAGLLLIRSIDNQAQIMVLDGSGITLCSWCRDQAGKISRIKGIGPIIKQGLPAYLASALEKIFSKTDNDGCQWQGFSRLCIKETGHDGRRKICRLGPFPLWQVEYWYKKKESDNWQQARLSGIAMGPEVLLEAMNNGRIQNEN
ncbi:MAG: hypothetical protein KAJ45_09295 [Desulfobulbaceae bacterium]|nr:hypothetical protein [Desulfobulbaceae bacterium]